MGIKYAQIEDKVNDCLIDTVKKYNKHLKVKFLTFLTIKIIYCIRNEKRRFAVVNGRDRPKTIQLQRFMLAIRPELTIEDSKPFFETEEEFNKLLGVNITEAEKELLRLRYLYDFTQIEIADMYGLSQSEISRRLTVARQYLASDLERRGIHVSHPTNRGPVD